MHYRLRTYLGRFEFSSPYGIHFAGFDRALAWIAMHQIEAAHKRHELKRS